MSFRLPRRLHAGAWWLWAIGLVIAATRTTNPLLLGMILAASALVVAARRESDSWAGGYRAYLVVALVVIAVRVVFRIMLGGDFGAHILFELPSPTLPSWLGGMALGGAVTVEELLAGLYDGLRLATVVACIGAANTLADPRRLVSSLPQTLGAVATSAVVALSLAPQLVESFFRVRRARRLRGDASRGFRSLPSLLVPLLEDTLHRSLALAASMESRGYGHRSGTTALAPRLLMWTGLAVTVAASALLVTGGSSGGAVLLGIGAVTVGGGLVWGGRARGATRYRPEPWGGDEWVVAVSGVVAAAAVIATGLIDPGALRPALVPLDWPAFSPLAIAGIALSAAPALASPPTVGAAPHSQAEGVPG